ncbi:PAS domain S-box protein [Methanosarcina sp. Mfa9]|uniref:PAS domain S-box protein n=1 Tax=Methanosarcina sp. Mfa9 TaxID=3439063 RepID=UPI003F82F42B
MSLKNLARGIIISRNGFQNSFSGKKKTGSEKTDFFEVFGSFDELGAVFENIPSVIFLRKAEAGFPVEFVSANVSHFGYEAADFKDGNLLYSDLIHPEDLEAFGFGIISNSERGIRGYTQKYRVLTKAGKVRWVEDRTLVRYGQKGRIRDYIGFIRDITEEKELEEKLEYSEKKFKALMEYSDDAIIIHDRDGKFLEANETSCKRLGYSKEELLQMTPYDLDAKYKKSLPKQFKRIYRDGKATFETVHVRKDGAVIPIKLSTHIMEYDGKTMVLTVAKDMREQKRTKEDLLYAMKVRKVLETVVNNSPVVVFLCLPEHKWPVEFISENISKFGYSVEDFTGGKLLFGDIIHPSDFEKVKDSLMRNCSEGKTDFTLEYRILTKDGQVRWVDERTFIQTDEKGDTSYLQCVIMDITERKQESDFLRIQCDLGIALITTDDFKETFKQLLELALQVSPIDSGCLYLINKETGDLSMETQRGLSPSFLKFASHYDGNSVMARLARNGQPVYKHHSEICSLTNVKLQPHETLKATAFLPILYKGELVAALKLISRTEDEIPETARKVLETIATEIGVAIGRVMEKTELKKTCNDLEALFNALNDFLFIVDVDGCIAQCNQAVSKKLGYSPEELKGKSIISLHPQNKLLEAAGNFSQLLAGKKSSCTIPFVSKKGIEVPAETRISRGKWKGREVFISLSRPSEEAEREE